MIEEIKKQNNKKGANYVEKLNEDFDSDILERLTGNAVWDFEKCGY